MLYLLLYPVMYKKELKEILNDLVRFKSNMGVRLSLKKVQYIWGKGALKEIEGDMLKRLEKGTKYEGSDIVKNKIYITKENLSFLLVLNWVQFVGISGSVSAGFAKEEDDIDLVIVVRNHSAWIYRGILTLRNLFNHVMRTGRDGNNVKDLFCINFILEERGLTLDSDMFNFHELMYLIPVYNERYLNYIYKKNSWLRGEYLVNKELLSSREMGKKDINILVRLVNYGAYFSQVAFMIVSGHRPEILRILSNYKKGRIEFFPKDFKRDILGKLNPV